MERTGKELLIASKQFSQECRATSWWHFWSTLTLMCLCYGVALAPLPLYIALPASILAGLVMIRFFIMFHDYMHGAFLRNSVLVKWVMHTFGMLMLTPALNWKHSHDDHHKHNCDEFGASLGSFPVMTTESYAKAPIWTKIGYRIARNPLIILFGYLTTFFLSNIFNFVYAPRRNLASGISVVLHVLLCVIVGMYSLQSMFLGIILPMMIACGLGAYLFYAQHNFPGMKRKKGHEWDYVYAALFSSSYMKMGRVMNWFTGNIGFHHVHHLNAKIPFYRLPEAMAEMEELQEPIATSLKPSDVVSCLQLKLWDPIDEKLLTFREARQLRTARSA